MTAGGAPASGEPLTDLERLYLERRAVRLPARAQNALARLLASEAHWRARCERAEAALREMAGRVCRGERMGFPHCHDVTISPLQWCEPCYAAETLRALSGARPGEGQ